MGNSANELALVPFLFWGWANEGAGPNKRGIAGSWGVYCNPLVIINLPYDSTPDLEQINGFYTNGVGKALSLTTQLLGVGNGWNRKATVRLSVLGSWVHKPIFY